MIGRCFKLTNFQDERKQIFRNVTFSTQRKEAVLEALQPKKRKYFLPSIIGIAVIATMLFLIINPLSKVDVNENQAFTEASLKESYMSLYEEPQENEEILFVKLGAFEENDAIIITNNDGDFTSFTVNYAYFDDNDWKFDGFTSFGEWPESSSQINWNILRGQTKTIFVGVMPDGVDKVYVGTEEAPIYEVAKMPRFWLSDAQSEGTPVYYEKNNKRERILDMDLNIKLSALKVVEASDENYIHNIATDEMNGLQDSFTDFPLVIDRQIYLNSEPNFGDVVLVHTSNDSYQLARVIISGEEIEITITEGSILFNGFFTPIPTLTAQIFGKNNVYIPGTRVYNVPAEQYFLKSDNWGSEYQVEGVYSKDKIIGKVMGYSLMDVTLDWPTEVVSLYNQYAKDKKDEMLRDVSPVQVAMLQKYAKSIGDYETMYALYAESTTVRTFDEWYELNKLTDTKQNRQWSVYEAHLLQKATFNEDQNELLVVDERTKERKYAMNMVKENGVWKVKYETIINVNY